jgi:hypothetical protein
MTKYFFIIKNYQLGQMNVNDLNVLIEKYKVNLPGGKIKSIILKTCIKIRSRALNFNRISSILSDLAEFDEQFYGPIYDQWKEEIELYTIDDAYEMFIMFFMDFRHAVHRSLAENNEENESLVSEDKILAIK